MCARTPDPNREAPWVLWFSRDLRRAVVTLAKASEEAVDAFVHDLHAHLFLEEIRVAHSCGLLHRKYWNPKTGGIVGFQWDPQSPFVRHISSFAQSLT